MLDVISPFRTTGLDYLVSMVQLSSYHTEISLHEVFLELLEVLVCFRRMK